MHSKIRVVISHKEYAGSFINRRSDGLTTDIDSAITFKDEGEASEWLLNCIYAPEDKECYTYKRVEITKRVLEDEADEREYESLRESQISP